MGTNFIEYKGKILVADSVNLRVQFTFDVNAYQCANPASDCLIDLSPAVCDPEEFWNGEGCVGICGDYIQSGEFCDIDPNLFVIPGVDPCRIDCSGPVSPYVFSPWTNGENCFRSICTKGIKCGNGVLDIGELCDGHPTCTPDCLGFK